MHRHNEGDLSALVAGTEDNMAMVLREIGEHERRQASTASGGAGSPNALQGAASARTPRS